MPTRFYFPSTGSAAVSPAFSGSWDNTDDATRLPLVEDTASSTAMATTKYRDNSNQNQNHLIHQWVSVPIDAQTIAAQTFEFQMRCLELDTVDNMVITIGARVVSNDGSTVTGTLFDVTRDGTEMATGTLTNRRFTVTTTEVTANAGDRIVIEVGCGGDPQGGGNHDADIRIGDNGAADLAEDDADTDDDNPWIEFPNTISFQTSQDATATPSLASITDIFNVSFS